MGLLDSIAGQVMGSLSGSNSGQHSALVDEIGGLINNHSGGLSGLVSAFEQQGLGNIVGSWVGSGQNHAISPTQIQAVLGNAQIQAIAQKLGFSPQELSSHLAELLPQIVDKMTPAGSLPGGGMLGGLLGALK